MSNIKPRFAPVMPIQIAEDIFTKAPNLRGNYHLLIGSDVLQFPFQYSQVYKDMRRENRVVIMDNSVIETGESHEMPDIMDAAKTVKANVACLPDAILDGIATVELTKKAFGQIRNQIDQDNEFWTATRYMMIPQGTCVYTWSSCLERMMEQMERYNLEHYVHWVGIAKNMRDRIGISRYRLIEIIDRMTSTLDIHLLGMSNDLIDDFFSVKCGHPRVKGIDSAVPIRIAYQANQSFNIHSKVGRRNDWWENPYKAIVEPDMANHDKTQRTVAIENIMYVRKLIAQ